MLAASSLEVSEFVFIDLSYWLGSLNAGRNYREHLSGVEVGIIPWHNFRLQIYDI
jgi:hypothetical protein